jgi:hypothetical protein
MEVPGSYLGPEIGYPDFFHHYPQSLQVNDGIMGYIGHDRVLPD